MIYIKKHNLCFVRVPKNASVAVYTFMRKTMYDPAVDSSGKAKMAHHTREEEGYDKYGHNIPGNPRMDTGHLTVDQIKDLGIGDDNTKFFGIVREPFERHLSLYLFRIKGKLNGEIPSPEGFQARFKDGRQFEDWPWQQAEQHTFLRDQDEWWSYDYLDWNIIKFSCQYELNANLFEKLNVSPGKKKELIDIFYTPQLKREVERAYEKDFELYERITKRDADLYGVRS